MIFDPVPFTNRVEHRPGVSRLPVPSALCRAATRQLENRAHAFPRAHHFPDTASIASASPAHERICFISVP